MLSQVPVCLGVRGGPGRPRFVFFLTFRGFRGGVGEEDAGGQGNHGRDLSRDPRSQTARPLLTRSRGRSHPRRPRRPMAEAHVGRGSWGHVRVLGQAWESCG